MGQTVNLGIKYEKQIQQQFSIGSLLQNRLENNLDFVGAKTVRVHTINTVALNDYDRTAPGNRYGVPEELGDSVQELTMTQDKGFTSIVDKGNSLDQAINKAGKFVRAEIDEVVIPTKDRYGFVKLAKGAGSILTNTAALDGNNVIERMGAARSLFLNTRVPRVGRTWFVRSEVYDALVKTEQFKNIGQMGGKAIATGQVGEIFGSPVVEVPEDLMPAGVNFLLVHKSAASSPSKIADTKVHIDPPGISGHLVEGRYYWDTFIFGAKAGGIYVDLKTGDGVQQLAAPVIGAGGAISGVAGGATVRYTLDGTDSRYSMSAKEGTATGAGAGVTVRAYQFAGEDEKSYPSKLAEKTL